jgi:Domain of unknown function (DUF3598)
MKSQWECILQNVGEWPGSFTLIAANGETLEDIPSHISLTGIDDNKTMHLVLNRWYPVPGSTELAPKELVMDFSTPGAGALFFETGAFSEGSLDTHTPNRFGSEFCLISPAQDRRLRIVQIFDEAKIFLRLTLIREQRQGSNAPEQPPLLLEDFVGNWQGQATILKPQKTDSETVFMETRQEDSLEFERDGVAYRTLLLPDGAFSTCPVNVRSNTAFSLEIGWLIAPNKRQRLIRQYDAAGYWIAVILIMETRNLSKDHGSTPT